MSTRIDDGSSHTEDDWFAPHAAAPTEPVRENAYSEHESEWEIPNEWGHDDPASRDVARRHIGIVLAVVVAIFLVLAGILVGRITEDSTTTVVTITSTVEAPATSDSTTPAATTPAETTPATTSPAETTPGPTSVPAETTLRPGTKGSSSVAALQEALVTLGYAPGAADGSYGPATVEAVAAFQTANNLTADGVAGPATLAAINAALAKG